MKEGPSSFLLEGLLLLEELLSQVGLACYGLEDPDPDPLQGDVELLEGSFVWVCQGPNNPDGVVRGLDVPGHVPLGIGQLPPDHGHIHTDVRHLEKFAVIFASSLYLVILPGSGKILESTCPGVTVEIRSELSSLPQQIRSELSSLPQQISLVPSLGQFLITT